LGGGRIHTLNERCYFDGNLQRRSGRGGRTYFSCPPCFLDPYFCGCGPDLPLLPGGGGSFHFVVSCRLMGYQGCQVRDINGTPGFFFVPHAGAVPVGSGCVVVALCDPPTLRIGEVPPSMVAHTPRSPPEGGGGRDFARV